MEHGAEKTLASERFVAKEVGDNRAEEEPPEFQGAVELFEGDGLDAIVELAEMLGGAADGGESFGRGAAEFGIFQDADAQALKCLRWNFTKGDWSRQRVARIGSG